MCDYNQASRAAVRSLPGPLVQAYRYLGRPAHHKLLQTLANGRVRPGHDLYDGKPLPPSSLSLGHYMSPQNFERNLARMAAHPYRCDWCGAPLPTNLVRQHQQPHNHREDLAHHHHPQCWKARLVATAVVFGHVEPCDLLSHKAPRRPKQVAMRQKVILSVKRILTFNAHHRRNGHRTWRQ